MVTMGSTEKVGLASERSVLSGFADFRSAQPVQYRTNVTNYDACLIISLPDNPNLIYLLQSNARIPVFAQLIQEHSS
jgi:hypothetical protein